MKKPVSYFIGEGILIVFSILAALGVNEWRVHAGQKAEERKAIADLMIELQENREFLEGAPRYHQQIGQDLLAAIDMMAPDDQRTPMEIFQTLEVLRPSIIIDRFPQDVSWQTAKDRGVVARLDYEEAKSLSALYDNQLVTVTSIYQKIGELLLSNEMFVAENQRSTLTSLAASFGEAAGREELLVHLLDVNIERLSDDADSTVD